MRILSAYENIGADLAIVIKIYQKETRTRDEKIELIAANLGLKLLGSGFMVLGASFVWKAVFKEDSGITTLFKGILLGVSGHDSVIFAENCRRTQKGYFSWLNWGSMHWTQGKSLFEGTVLFGPVYRNIVDYINGSNH